MKCVRFAFLALAAMLLAVGVYAQTTGSIEGTIIDETKAPLPGVTIEASSPRLEGTRIQTSDAQGRFRFDGLPPGGYTIKFTLAGFATQEQTNVAVGEARVVTLQVQMRSAYKEEVTVTGTLIPRPTLEAMSPVTTMDVEELSYRGLTRLEDLLTTLPQVFAAQNSTIANGASGTATVDLRHLGAVRTLVLIDGKRMSAGDTGSISPDLNFIPSALVKRVDVLTGGASSVYGADAVAGVVNFILDKDFEGVRGGIEFGGYQHDNSNKTAEAALAARHFFDPKGQVWDGGALAANVAVGGKFAEGRGHASLYLDYRKTSALLKKYRDYTACSFSSLGPTGPRCGGSGTIPDGQFQAYDADFNLTGIYTLDRSGPGNTFRNRVGTDVFNYGPINYMQRPDIRYTGGGFVDYEWNPHAQGYMSVMLMDDFTDAQIAPSGDFGNTAQLNCDNPMLSADQVQKLCTNAGFGPHDIANVVILKRNVEGGPRIDQLRHTAFRLVAGLKGEISKAWSYDVYGLHAQVQIPEVYVNDLNVARLQEALLVDGNPADPSTWHCRSGNAACVPWNIFKVGGVTPAAAAYLQLPLISTGSTKTQLVSGKITGDLKDWGLAFPSATEGLQLALGAEYRKEFLDFNPDESYREGNASGQGGARVPVTGFYSVREAFGELLVPIVQGARGAQNLALELGYRYSDYNINGSFPSWKAQATWAPVSDFKFRVGRNRATRAPNVVELFQPRAIDLAGTQDVCAGPTPSFTQAECARTGMTAAQYGHVLENPAGQYNDFYGGNPNLRPEIADTTTYGIVITPAGSSFTAALDYYKIDIKDTIGSLLPDDIISACATTGNAALCSLIHRDIAGTLWLFPTGYTEDTSQNIGKLGAEGVDASLSYNLPAGHTFFSFSLMGSYMMKSTIDTGIYAYDCATFFGNQCGDPTPKWRHIARISWETGPVVLTLGWRYVGSVKNDDTSSNPAIGNPGNIALLKINDSLEIPAFNYFDLAVGYKLKAGVSFLLGVNNIADKEPPLGSGSSPNDYGPGFHGTYDPYGRYIFSNIQFTF